MARGVVGIGREHAAEVLLTARAAEKLVVGGQQLDGAVGQRPHLDARAGQRLAGDPLLDDAAVLLEGGQVGVDGRAFRPPAACSSRRSVIAAASSGEPGSGSPVRSTMALPAPETPSLSFTIAWLQRRPPRAHALHARHDVVDRVEVLRPDRTPHPEFLEHPAAAGLAAEVREPRDPRRTSGCRGSARRPARAVWCCRGSGGCGPGWGSGTGSRAEAVAAQAASRSAASGDASPTGTSVSRARAWLGITPGSSPR